MNCIDCGARPAFVRKRCKLCYERWRRSADFQKVQNAAHLLCRICGKPAEAMGLCQTHYMRLYRHGDPNVVTPTPPPPKRARTERTCLICGGKHYARGYCGKHYARWLVHGDPNVVFSTHRRLVQGG